MAEPPLEPIGFIVQRSQNGATFTLAHPSHSGMVREGDHVTVWSRNVSYAATAKVLGQVTEVQDGRVNITILRTEVEAGWPAACDILEPGSPVYLAVPNTFEPRADTITDKPDGYQDHRQPCC